MALITARRRSKVGTARSRICLFSARGEAAESQEDGG